MANVAHQRRPTGSPDAALAELLAIGPDRFSAPGEDSAPPSLPSALTKTAAPAAASASTPPHLALRRGLSPSRRS